MKPKQGMMLLVSLPNGSQIPAKITEVTNEEIVLTLTIRLQEKTLILKSSLWMFIDSIIFYYLSMVINKKV